jgi:hypothetical protein
MTLLSQLNNIATDLQTAKNNIATAITAKGVSASGDEAFANLTTKISNIETGSRDYDIFYVESYKLQTKPKVGDYITIINGLQANLFTTKTSYLNSASATQTGTASQDYQRVLLNAREGYTDRTWLMFCFQIHNTSNVDITTTTFDSTVYASRMNNNLPTSFDQLVLLDLTINNRYADKPDNRQYGYNGINYSSNGNTENYYNNETVANRATRFMNLNENNNEIQFYTKMMSSTAAARYYQSQYNFNGLIAYKKAT